MPVAPPNMHTTKHKEILVKGEENDHHKPQQPPKGGQKRPSKGGKKRKTVPQTLEDEIDEEDAVGWAIPFCTPQIVRAHGNITPPPPPGG